MTRIAVRFGRGYHRRTFRVSGRVDIQFLEPLDSALQGAQAWAAAVRLRDAARAQMLLHCGEPDHGHRRFLAELARAQSGAHES